LTEGRVRTGSDSQKSERARSTTTTERRGVWCRRMSQVPESPSVHLFTKQQVRTEKVLTVLERQGACRPGGGRNTKFQSIWDAGITHKDETGRKRAKGGDRLGKILEQKTHLGSAE